MCILFLLAQPCIIRQMAPSHEDLPLPFGPNMHASASSTQQRRPSWHSRRLSSIRSGTCGHTLSSRHSISSANARNTAHDVSLRQQLEQEHLRCASLSASAQSSPPKWWRICFFRGMMNDIKRRAPYYWSDWTDAWDYRIVPATVYMYFAKYVLSLIDIEITLFLLLRVMVIEPSIKMNTRNNSSCLPELTLAAVSFLLWLSHWICLKRRTRASVLMKYCSRPCSALSFFLSLLLNHWSLSA